MKKLHLELDELRVETFATGTETALRGTVQGNARNAWERLDGGTGYAPRTAGSPDCPNLTEPIILMPASDATCGFCPSEPPICLW